MYHDPWLGMMFHIILILLEKKEGDIGRVTDRRGKKGSYLLKRLYNTIQAWILRTNEIILNERDDVQE